MITRVNRGAGRAAIGIALLAVAAGCRPTDPWVLLSRARQAHRVEMLTWTEGKSLDSEEGKDALVSLRVVERGSPLALPCLTVDVVFETGEGPQAREVGRAVREIDLTGLGEAGGALETVLRVPLPAGGPEVDRVGVALHPAGPDELRELCEAKAVGPGAT